MEVWEVMEDTVVMGVMEWAWAWEECMGLVDTV